MKTEDEALDKIRQTREKHWDASHNVYAYILKECSIMRYSDDGEPQGTSGLPVLGVFKSAGVFDVCCIVTAISAAYCSEPAALRVLIPRGFPGA